MTAEPWMDGWMDGGAVVVLPLVPELQQQIIAAAVVIYPTPPSGASTPPTNNAYPAHPL